MKLTRLTLALAGAAILGGCASGAKIDKDISHHLKHEDQQNQMIEQWEKAAAKITYIDRKSPLIIEEPHKIPAKVANIEISSGFQKDATVFHLIGMLKALDIHLVVPEKELLSKEIVLFEYEGKLGDYLNALGVAYGISFNWNPGNIMTAESSGFYTLSIPQDKIISEIVAKDIKQLGAEAISSTVNTGSISYKAGYRTNQRIINYLERLNLNTSLVSMQVAVINVALDKRDARGIDWSQLNLGLGLSGMLGQGFDPVTFSASEEGTLTGGYGNIGEPEAATSGNNGNNSNNSNNSNNNNNGNNNNGPTYLAPRGTNLNDMAVGATLGGMGSSIGFAKGDFNLGLAIDYLSTFGKTEASQNLILKTLSGRTVGIKSGDTIPYIGEVSTTQNSSNSGDNGNGSLGGAKAEEIETGLNIELNPFFDSESQLLTIGVDLALSQLVRMVELSAGNQIGTLTAPHTSEQEFNNVVTMRAGESVLLGGLIVDRSETNNNAPIFAPSAAHTDENFTRTAMFIMLRPTVTVFGNFSEDKKVIR